MADRGRDLKVSILSDADRFDVDKPVKELEKLGEEALDAKRDLDKLWDEANASKLDKLGDEAKSTASKVDSAFEKIAASSKSNLRKVDDDVDHARRGMDDMKGEAGQSGREAAASFSGGFDSVTDFMQETAANALAGFGAVGGALGIAAAAGMGFLANKAAEAAENIKAARDSLRELYSNNDTTGLDKTKDFFEFLADVGTDLPGLDRALHASGLTMEQFVKAGRDGGPVFEEVKRRLRDLGDEGAGLAGFWDGNVRGAQGAYDALTQYREGADGAIEDLEKMGPLLAEQEEKNRAAAAAQEDAAAAAQHHAETIGTVTESLKGAAEGSGELAAAIAEDGQVSIRAVTDALIAQTEAAKNHKKNLEVALKEGGEEFLAWMSQQPAEVAAAYVKGSDKERARLRAAAAANGVAMGEGTAAGIVSSRPTTVAAAAATHEHVRRKLEGEPVVIPVTVGSATGVDSVAEQIRRRFGTITVPVNVGDIRWGRGQFLP